MSARPETRRSAEPTGVAGSASGVALASASAKPRCSMRWESFIRVRTSVTVSSRPSPVYMTSWILVHAELLWFGSWVSDRGYSTGVSGSSPASPCSPGLGEDITACALIRATSGRGSKSPDGMACALREAGHHDLLACRPQSGVYGVVAMEQICAAAHLFHCYTKPRLHGYRGAGTEGGSDGLSWKSRRTSGSRRCNRCATF